MASGPAKAVEPSDWKEVPAEDWQNVPANEVAGARVAQTPKSPATVSPRETGVVPWLEDAEEDLRHGGTRTALGRGLGFMQGRGDKGYNGLESGTSPEVADTMGECSPGYYSRP